MFVLKVACLLITLKSCCIQVSVTMTAANMYPWLSTTTEHLTVVEGERATLPCTVQSMEDYVVLWISPKKSVISMGDRRLIDDQRMSVECPSTSTWNLLIRNIRHNDTGYYECRINTSPVQTKRVFLDVKEIGSGGEVLIIHNISRNCDDIYECYVDNGVPPAVSKAIRVVVNYAPEVHLQHPKRLGQYSGKETVLNCLIQANPLAVTDWFVEGQKITKSDKYDIEIYKNEVENILNLTLRIRDITHSEFGRYECFASNVLGEDKEDMYIFELTSTSTTTTTSSTAPADTTVSRKQPPHKNRDGDHKNAEHSLPNYNDINRLPENQTNLVTPANKSIAATVIKETQSRNETVTIMEGDNAVLPCSFNTKGYPKVVWLRPDHMIMSFQGRRMIDDVRVSVVSPDANTWNLQIKNISSKDTGFYQCRLYSDQSDPVQTKMIYLDVKSAKEIKKIQPMNVTTIHHVTETEGGNAVLPCTFKSSATGYVQVVWMSSDMTLISIEDLRITDDDRVSVKSPRRDVWNLHINNVSSKDTGYYRCSLANDSVKTEMVYLHVKERTKTSAIPATVTTPTFVQTTTIFRKRTPDKATSGHHDNTTRMRPGKRIYRPISKYGLRKTTPTLRRTTPTLRRTRPKLRRTRPTLRRTRPTLPSRVKEYQTSSEMSSSEMRRINYLKIIAILERIEEAMKVFKF